MGGGTGKPAHVLKGLCQDLSLHTCVLLFATN